jgi:hypothetical protein
MWQVENLFKLDCEIGFGQALDSNITNLIFLGILMAAPPPKAIVQDNTLQIWYPVILYHT